MVNNLNEFVFTSHIGMCGGGGISFKKESYSKTSDFRKILIDEDGDEYWMFGSSENPDGYVWSLWLHHIGFKAMALVGGGREKELEGVAFEALSAATRGDWASAKELVSAWDNNA